MLRSLAATWPLCYAVLGVASLLLVLVGPGAVSTAAAERRIVAVVDLAGDDTSLAATRARELHEVLMNHRGLMPIPDLVLQTELIGTLIDPDGDRMQRAQQAKLRAEQQLASFQFALAASIVDQAQAELLGVAPTPASVQLYAELAFLLGQARLGQRNAAGAASAFATAHRLAPTFAPDPARYVPEIIASFDAARTRAATRTKLAVVGRGRVWVDGRDVGLAPVEVEVEPREHVVWIAGPDRETRGKVVDVLSDGARIAMEDAPADDRLLVQRARIRLKRAPDPTARATAMKQLAALLRVGDAILLDVVNGKLVVQTWRDRAPGFSQPREARPTERADQLVKELAPPPAATVTRPRGPEPLPPPPPRPFYRKRTWQIVIASGVLGAIASSVVLYRNRDRFIGTITDAGFESGELAR